VRYFQQSANKDFSIRVIAGTRTVLLALNCEEQRLDGLMGFAFYRSAPGETTGRWLRSQKVFRSVVPDPSALVNGRPPVFRTDEHPIQSFLWGDYTAEPGARYTFRVVPKYGKPGQLRSRPDDEIVVEVETEPEADPSGHSIWFNRGAIASQQFVSRFGDVKPSNELLEDLDQPITKWLSRGLAEACIAFIDDVLPGDALRCCFYEFHYHPVLLALKRAIERGVDVKISFDDEKKNLEAISHAQVVGEDAAEGVLFPRTKPEIPHNKFMIRIVDGTPVSVWTGSTNITPSGFTGQSNVGHAIADPTVARQYLDYWEEISVDPELEDARKASTRISPHPVEVLPPNSTTVLFSPRYRSAMLKWYANRISDAQELVMFTAAFGVNEKLVGPISEERDFLRFVMMEKKESKAKLDQLRADRDVVVAHGAALGTTVRFVNGVRVQVAIPQFGLDKWFAKEEHFRKNGNIFYVHTKFLLIDPLSNDPLVCTGSANFSENSLLQNDENMLLIRGNTRVADIYLTEFDRLFRHFYFRNVANDIELNGGEAKGAFLDEGNDQAARWAAPYFRSGSMKTRRREMFFSTAPSGWAAVSASRPPKETAKLGDKPS
jgi:phosphatidylserine/phosphatidylglycerophosphate/cardiolipin synthase-like enzyme